MKKLRNRDFDHQRISQRNLQKVWEFLAEKKNEKIERKLVRGY